MRYLVLLALFAVGCLRPPCQPDEPPYYHEETYLPFQQPNRDPSYPKFQTLRVEDDGTYFEIDARSMPHPYENDWGRRKRVIIKSRDNAYWGHTSQSVNEVLEDVEDVNGQFRIHGISAPYFREDRRSFIDEKAFGCSAEEVCASLDEAIRSGDRFDLVMTFGPTFDAPLVLLSVESPTCQSTMDCTIREECCHVDGANICVEHMTCPKEQQVNYGIVGGRQ